MQSKRPSSCRWCRKRQFHEFSQEPKSPFCYGTGSKVLRETGILLHHVLSFRVLVSVAGRSIAAAEKVLTREVD